MPKTIEQQNADTQAKLMWTEGERRRQAAQNNQQITPDNYSRGSVRGNGVFTTSQDFGSASIGDNYLGDREQVQSYAPIEYKEEARLENLEQRKGLTDAFMESRNLMSSIGQQAAGLGINIKQINPNDPNQVELRNQYESARQSAHEIGNMLQRGQEVQEIGSKPGNYQEAPRETIVNGQVVQEASQSRDVGARNRYEKHVSEINNEAEVNDRYADADAKELFLETNRQRYYKLADELEAAGDLEHSKIARLAGDSIGLSSRNLKQEELALEKKKLIHKKKMDMYSKRKDTVGATLFMKEALSIYNTGELNVSPEGKNEIVSNNLNGRAFLDKNNQIVNIILNPEDGKPLIVRYQSFDKDKKPTGEVKEIEYGSDLNFIENILEGSGGDSEIKDVRNGISIIDSDGEVFDNNGDISARSGDASYSAVLNEAEALAKDDTSLNASEKKYDAGFSDWLTRGWSEKTKVGSVLTKAVLDAKGSESGRSQDGFAKKINIKPSLNPELKQYYIIPHHSDGNFNIVTINSDDNLELLEIDGYDPSDGLSKEEIVTTLGVKGRELSELADAKKLEEATKRNVTYTGNNTYNESGGSSNGSTTVVDFEKL